MIDHLQQQALYLEQTDMVQCSFNISDGQQASVGKYYQEAAAKVDLATESDSEVKKKGRKRR